MHLIVHILIGSSTYFDCVSNKTINFTEYIEEISLADPSICTIITYSIKNKNGKTLLTIVHQILDNSHCFVHGTLLEYQRAVDQRNLRTSDANRKCRRNYNQIEMFFVAKFRQQICGVCHRPHHNDIVQNIRDFYGFEILPFVAQIDHVQ